MASVLETIIRDAKVAFVVAKHDGQLEAAEVVQIAVQISQKVYALAGLSLVEKEAMVLLCMKKGLSAAGGLHGLAQLAQSGPEGLAAVEAQILNAGIAAANALRAAVPQLFAPVENGLLACLPFCSLLATAVETLLPKDKALVEEALQCLRAGTVPNSVVSTLESVAVKTVIAADPLFEKIEKVEDSPLPNTAEVEPSPAASS
jgi:hypothetical protein